MWITAGRLLYPQPSSAADPVFNAVHVCRYCCGTLGMPGLSCSAFQMSDDPNFMPTGSSDTGRWISGGAAGRHRQAGADAHISPRY